MKALLPVAGYGTRLRPHTDRIQKALLPVAGKPALDFIIEPLLAHGFDEITLVIGHLGDQIRKHLQAFRGHFTYIEQKERLGLGHAVLQGLEDSEEPVLVQLGDTIFDFDYSRVPGLTGNAVAVHPVEDPERFGVVELQGQDIIGFHEKVSNPPGNLALVGLYWFRSQQRLKAALEYLIREDIRTKNEYQITDAMQVMLRWGERFRPFEGVVWHDVGVPRTYIETNRALLRSRHAAMPGVTCTEPVFVAPSSSVTGSELGPYVTIMENCRISDCRIRDSIVLAGSRLQGQTISGKIVGGDGSQIC